MGREETQGYDVPWFDVALFQVALAEETSRGTSVCDTSLRILLGVTCGAVPPKTISAKRVSGQAGGASQPQCHQHAVAVQHVVHGAYLVPGLFTRGSAKHSSEAAHGASWNLLPTHCANWPWTHADSPDVHDEDAVRLWNFLLSACASFPFCSVNAARRSTGPAVTAVATKVRENTSCEKCMIGCFWVLGCTEE